MVLASCILTLLTGSAFAGNANLQSKRGSLKNAVNDDWAILGAPTLSATGMPTSSTICMDTSNVSIGTSPQAGLTFNSTASNLQLSRSLNLGLGLDGLQLYGITVGANASFASSTKNTDYTYNYTYLYTYSTKASLTTVYGNDNLSTSGKNALASGEAAFFQTCGDSFVSNLDAGAVIAVNVSITFKTKEQANEFNGSVSAGVSLVSIVPTLKMAGSKITKDAVIAVSALQNGGTPENLNDIFGKDPNTGSYNVSACGVDTPAACQALVDSIIAYSSTLGSQVKNDSGMIINNLFYFNPVLTSYSSVGVTVPAPKPLSTAAITAQNEVFDELNLSKSRIEFLNHYKGDSLPIQPDLNSYISSQTKTLNARIDYINSKAVNCFNAQAETCPAIVTQMKSTFNNSKTTYNFDAVKYGQLNSAWYYILGGNLTYLVPVSFVNVYSTYTTDKNTTNKTAQGYAATENGASYINQFVIPYKGLLGANRTYKCLPATGDNKFADSRTFVCNDGLTNLNMQFTKVANPL